MHRFTHTSKSILFLLLPLMFLKSAKAERRQRSNLAFILYASVDYGFSTSEADKIPNAAYTKKMINPLIINGALGLVVEKWVYFGTRFEHWIAERKFSPSGSSQTDSLKLQTLGLEVGYLSSNPRIDMMVSAAALYPIKLSVESSSTSVAYTNASSPFSFEVRAHLGIRFTSLHSFFVEGGYRFANMGKLVSAGQDFIVNQGVKDFDLSGPFAGFGIQFEF